VRGGIRRGGVYLLNPHFCFGERFEMGCHFEGLNWIELYRILRMHWRGGFKDYVRSADSVSKD
jgi:hypothetical protein